MHWGIQKIWLLYLLFSVVKMYLETKKTHCPHTGYTKFKSRKMLLDLEISFTYIPYITAALPR